MLNVLNLKFMEAQDKVREAQVQDKDKARVDKFELGEIVGFKQPPRQNRLYKNFEINDKVIKVIGP